MKIGVVALALASSLLSLVASARPAEEPKTVLILPLETPGLPDDSAKALDEVFRAEVQKGLSGKLTFLPAPKLDFQGLQLAAGCGDDGPGCLTAIGKELGVGRIIRGQLVGTAKKATFKMTMVRVQSGKVEVPAPEEMKDLDAESAAELRYHIVRMFGGKPAPLLGSIELVAGGKDPSFDSAEYFLDDQKVAGKTLAKVQPGDHRLSVHRPGFESVIWMGEVRPGKKTVVKVEWKTASAAPPPPVVAVVPPKSPPPPMTATPPPPTTPPPTSEQVSVTPEPPPRLLFTWVFATGTVVGAATWGVLGAQVIDRENQATSEYYDCANGDRDDPVCSGGRQLATFTNIAIVATGAFLAATVTAFFLEDGPTVLFGPAPAADGQGPGAFVAFTY
jgi:hypothetical protein